MNKPNKLTDVEYIKARSDFLRGTILTSLDDNATGTIAEDDTQLSKFHGIYQQDDRDLRSERKKQKLEPAHSFMIRVRVPGGVITTQQWLALDELARTHANNTLRITTRQAIQLHGVIKRKLKQTIQGVNQNLLDTIAACGDVNRNVMCTPNPVQSAVHQSVYECASSLSAYLTPQTSAYHEIWLDGKPSISTKTDQEPIYGDTYLPRKFKIGIAIPPRNDTDIFTQDLGFIAIVENGELAGFNVAVGGGMGMSHSEPDTYPRLGTIIGFCTPAQLNQVAEKVVTTQRDFGDRTNRKHARLKYTIDDRGLAWFKGELESRLGWSMPPVKPFEFNSRGDRYGWSYGTDGLWHLTLSIPNGRLKDDTEKRLLTGMRELAHLHIGEFRLTANQNVIVAGVRLSDKQKIHDIAKSHGLLDDQLTRLSANAMACVAFPTCGLAMAESERYLPELLKKMDSIIDKHKLADTAIVTRMTGCPNGCARPYAAEIGFVGKGPGKYNVYLGASFTGDRLNTLYRENMGEAEILTILDTMFADYKRLRKTGERFGDFLVRIGIVRRTLNRDQELANHV